MGPRGSRRVQSKMPLSIERVRACFPALTVTDNGRPRIYLDNPSGTQVPTQVIERMTRHLVHDNSNSSSSDRT